MARESQTKEGEGGARRALAGRRVGGACAGGGGVANLMGKDTLV